MKAHLFRDGRRWRFSGHQASGDPLDGAGGRSGKKPRAFDAVVELGADFRLTDNGLLEIVGEGPNAGSLWTPGEVFLAAFVGWFGFRLESYRKPRAGAK